MHILEYNRHIYIMTFYINVYQMEYYRYRYRTTLVDYPTIEYMYRSSTSSSRNLHIFH